MRPRPSAISTVKNHPPLERHPPSVAGIRLLLHQQNDFYVQNDLLPDERPDSAAQNHLLLLQQHVCGDRTVLKLDTPLDSAAPFALPPHQQADTATKHLEPRKKRENFTRDNMERHPGEYPMRSPENAWNSFALIPKTRGANFDEKTLLVVDGFALIPKTRGAN